MDTDQIVAVAGLIGCVLTLLIFYRHSIWTWLVTVLLLSQSPAATSAEQDVEPAPQPLEHRIDPNVEFEPQVFDQDAPEFTAADYELLRGRMR